MLVLDVVRDYTFKSFKNYSGPFVDPFKRKNIFFGYNGKGKSALARGILEEFKKDNTFGTENYRFFDKDFIRENLLMENSFELKGIVANIGKQNIDIEKVVQEKTKEIVDTSLISTEIELTSKKIREEITKIFETKKGDSSIKRKNSENIIELVELYKKDLAPAMKIVKSKDELRNLKDSSVYEKELVSLQTTQLINIEILSNEEIKKIEEIMLKKYNNNEIPSALVLSWLEEGLNIHKEDDSKKCKFCGNEIKLFQIEDKIKMYLSDKKQQDLIELDKIYNKIINIYNTKTDISKNKDVIIKLLGEKSTAHCEEIISALDHLDIFLKKIAKKISEFENSCDFDSNELSCIMKFIQENIEQIEKIKMDNENELIKMIEKNNILIKGAISLEICESTLICDELVKLKTNNQSLREAINNNDKLRKEIIELKKSKSTTNDFASFINELLKELGIDFYLDVIDNNYTIKHNRDDVILKLADISEGENNLLALLFFYYELFNDKKQRNFKEEIRIIIMDDPISSIDDVNKVYVLELIKKIIELEVPQIFIFTHVWEDFCNICYGKKDAVDRNGNETAYRFYEIKKNNEGSYIKKTKTNETPYMHDFNEIYEFSKLENANDIGDCEMYHYPNVMRKVLEQFMSFKVKKYSPTLDNITNVKIALCGSVNCSHQDEIQIPALLDMCNILSHKTRRTPDQILSSAQYLMRKIREQDINHFSAMTN